MTMSTDEKKHVLIAVDNSEFSDRALQNYFEIFHRPTNQVTLVHVTDPVRVHMVNALRAALLVNETDIQRHEGEREDKLRKIISKYMSLCKDKYHTEIRMLIRETNSVGQVIVQVAEAEHCSAIVLGCQGHGLRRAMLGSVSSYVLHHAKIPVAVCQ